MSLSRPAYRKLPTYAELVRSFGIEVCEGPPKHVCGSSVDDHMAGFVTRNGGSTKLHWRMTSEHSERPRKANRQALYIFLKHVFFTLRPESREWATWRVIYEASKFATETATRLGFRIGRGPTEKDRSKVKYLLRDPASRDSERAQAAWRWTEQRYD